LGVANDERLAASGVDGRVKRAAHRAADAHVELHHGGVARSAHGADRCHQNEAGVRVVRTADDLLDVAAFRSADDGLTQQLVTPVAKERSQLLGDLADRRIETLHRRIVGGFDELEVQAHGRTRPVDVGEDTADLLEVVPCLADGHHVVGLADRPRGVRSVAEHVRLDQRGGALAVQVLQLERFRLEIRGRAAARGDGSDEHEHEPLHVPLPLFE
jgi:hypothetical protein